MKYADKIKSRNNEQGHRLTHEFLHCFVPNCHSTIFHESKQLSMNCSSSSGELVGHGCVLQSVKFHHENREPHFRFSGKEVSENMRVQLNGNYKFGIIMHHLDMDVGIYCVFGVKK